MAAWAKQPWDFPPPAQRRRKEREHTLDTAIHEKRDRTRHDRACHHWQHSLRPGVRPIGIFDLTAVTTMDSAAIGAVVRCFRKLKGLGGDLRLACAPPVIARSLEQTKVNKIVRTYLTTAEAARDFAHQ